MMAATCIIAWLNLTNDVFDSHTGVDKADYKPESVVNLTGSRYGRFARSGPLKIFWEICLLTNPCHDGWWVVAQVQGRREML